MATVALGLLAAVTWGAADFGGGTASRRTPLFGVVLGMQLVGLVFAAVLAVARGEPPLGPGDLAWSIVAGLFATVGLLTLYAGLAAGRMGVVAPVTGVLTAVVPVLVGIVLEGPPPAIAVAGIVLALAAVVLVSFVADGGSSPSGIQYAIVAGLAIGAYSVAVSRVSEGQVFGPLLIVRVIGGLLITATIVVGRRPWRPRRSAIGLIALVGVVDMVGNAFFVAATQIGPLAVAAVLSSMYPVTTVLLAIGLLGERVTRTHLVGIAAAAGAIVLIGLGSTTPG